MLFCQFYDERYGAGSVSSMMRGMVVFCQFYDERHGAVLSVL